MSTLYLAKQINLNITAGVNFEREFIVKQRDGIVPDLGSVALWASLEKSVWHPETKVNFTVAVLDAPTGHVKISLNPIQTHALPTDFQLWNWKMDVVISTVDTEPIDPFPDDAHRVFEGLVRVNHTIQQGQ